MIKIITRQFFVVALTVRTVGVCFLIGTGISWNFFTSQFLFFIMTIYLIIKQIIMINIV